MTRKTLSRVGGSSIPLLDVHFFNVAVENEAEEA